VHETIQRVRPRTMLQQIRRSQATIEGVDERGPDLRRPSVDSDRLRWIEHRAAPCDPMAPRLV